jgi:hypothetical protein
MTGMVQRLPCFLSPVAATNILVITRRILSVNNHMDRRQRVTCAHPPKRRRDFGRWCRSANASQQIARLAQYDLRLPTFLNAFTRISAVLKRVLVPLRCPRSRSPAMHPTALPPTNGRRVTGLTRSRLCSTPRARAHRARITQMIGDHLVFSSRNLPCRFMLFTAV